MAGKEYGAGDSHKIETRLTAFLGPYEPVIMRIQSLVVWEYPWKSAILFTSANLLFWYIYVSSLRFFFLVSLVVMVVVLIDTWKNRIWPEIRVPPKDPEDRDGWTPVHPRLLSVPEISTVLSDILNWLNRTFQVLRGCRTSHPLVFCVGNTIFFTVTAIVGCHISGVALVYISTMSLMLWPAFIYHSVPAKLYKRMEPGFQWLSHNVTGKFKVVFDCVGKLIPRFGSSSDNRVEEEEFVPQENSEAAAALRKAIYDYEDDNGNSSSLATPGLSTSPSFNNSEEDSLDQQDFDLEINQMPSFDDLDNTDDELDLPSRVIDSLASSQLSSVSNLSRLSALQFSAGHFGDSESEDEHTLSENVDFADSNMSNNSAQSALQGLGGAFVARTISSMMETALQGVAYLGQGQSASSSSVIPRTGAKITYTCTEEGESIDFQNPHATILESEEDFSDSEPNEHIAEIEKDFDFLQDLDSDS